MKNLIPMLVLMGLVTCGLMHCAQHAEQEAVPADVKSVLMTENPTDEVMCRCDDNVCICLEPFTFIVEKENAEELEKAKPVIC